MNQKQRKIAVQEKYRNLVCRLIQITHEDFYQMQFELAEEHMVEKCQGDEDLLSQFLQATKFWLWWRQQWRIIDQEFYEAHKQNKHVSEGVLRELRKLYTHQHRRINTYPDKVIYDKIHDSYSELVKQLKNKENEA
jgi:hypothetical protein